MSEAVCVFKRREKKYLLTEKQYEAFIDRAAPYIKKDRYGEYTICNLYYDTDDYQLIRASIEKPEYKEKLRLRSYGVPGPADKVFIEIKKKYEGTVYKRRSILSLRQAEAYLDRGIKPQSEDQIIKEIEYFINFYHTKAKVYLAYDREAFAGGDRGDLRITFDRNIRSRDYDLSLGAGDYGQRLLPEGACLMEIKACRAMPLELAHILSELKIYPRSFSKYGNVYKKNICGERIIELSA